MTPVHLSVWRRSALIAALAWFLTPIECRAQPDNSAEILELRNLDLTGWDCLNKPEGIARTPDGAERNRMKNRGPSALPTGGIKAFDTAGFREYVAAYDKELVATRRVYLTAGQKERLASFENQVVSITGYVVLSYVGPPESTNCGDPTLVDWHLELFAKPGEHAPMVGDPTPIICEITPRTERNVYRDNIRIRQISAFFRLFHDLSILSMGHAAPRVRVTGNLFWDDDHNGKADIGATISYFTANKYHHPWRSTAWEIHPVMKIEILD